MNSRPSPVQSYEVDEKYIPAEQTTRFLASMSFSEHTYGRYAKHNACSCHHHRFIYRSGLFKRAGCEQQYSRTCPASDTVEQIHGG